MAHSEKELMLREITKHVKDSSGMMIANFNKLSVIEIDELRKKLRKNNSRLIVTKNTLLKRMFAEMNLDVSKDCFGKNTGIALYRNDPVSVAKMLFDFSKNHESFTINGAVVDGAILSAKAAKQLSELPSKDVLRAMVLSRMQSPISGLVNVLSGTIRGLVNVMDQIRKQKNG